MTVSNFARPERQRNTAYPAIVDALDASRFRELKTRTVLATNLWLALNLAAQRGDADEARRLWAKIRAVSVDARDLLTALGSPEPDNG